MAEEEPSRDGVEPVKKKRRRREHSEEEFKKRRWRRRLVIFGVVVALGFGVFVWKRDGIMQRVNGIRGDWLANRAMGAVESGDYREAWRQINESYRLSPQRIPVTRALARYYEGVDIKQAIGFYQALWWARKATGEDGKALLNLYVDVGYYTDADVLGDELLERYPSDVDVVYEVSKLQRVLERREREMDLLQRVMEIDPDHMGARYGYALGKIASPIPDVAEVGWADVFEIAKGKDEIGLEALYFLQENRDRAAMPQEHFLKLLREHPKRNTAREPEIAVLEWELALDGEGRGERVAAALESWDGVLDPDGMAKRLRWLNEAGYAREVATFLNLEQLEKMPSLLFICLDAFVRMGDFGAAHNMLDTYERRGRPIAATLGRAALLSDQGRSREDVDKEFEGAILLAATKKEDEWLLLTGRMAMETGRFFWSEEAFKLAQERRPVDATIGLVLLSERRGDSSELLTHYDALKDLQPEDLYVSGRAAYVRLLLGKDVDVAAEYARTVLERNATDSRANLVMAMWHSGRGEDAAALDRCKVIRGDSLQNGERAVLAGIRARSGDRAGAEVIAGQVNRDELLPEELDTYRAVQEG